MALFDNFSTQFYLVLLFCPSSSFNYSVPVISEDANIYFQNRSTNDQSLKIITLSSFFLSFYNGPDISTAVNMFAKQKQAEIIFSLRKFISCFEIYLVLSFLSRPIPHYTVTASLTFASPRSSLSTLISCILPIS